MKLGGLCYQFTVISDFADSPDFPDFHGFSGFSRIFRIFFQNWWNDSSKGVCLSRVMYYYRIYFWDERRLNYVDEKRFCILKICDNFSYFPDFFFDRCGNKTRSYFISKNMFVTLHRQTNEWITFGHCSSVFATNPEPMDSSNLCS